MQLTQATVKAQCLLLDQNYHGIIAQSLDA